MRQIVTIDGQPFEVNMTGEMTQEAYAQIQAMARQQMQAMGGCLSCGGGGLKVMAAPTCPANVLQGSTHTLTASASGGQAPLSYTWVIRRPDNVPDTRTGSTVSYTFTQAGTYTINLTVTDSCSTQQQCDSSCNVVSGAVARYNCVNAACVQDPNGTYADLASCQAACAAPAKKYRCSGAPNYTCVEDPNGTDLATCQAACKQPPTCTPLGCSFNMV